MAKNELSSHLRLMEDIANCLPLDGFDNKENICNIIKNNSLCLNTQVGKALESPDTPVAIIPTGGKHKTFVLSEATHQSLKLAAKNEKVDVSCFLLQFQAINENNFNDIYLFFKNFKEMVNSFLQICREQRELPEAVLSQLFYKYEIFFKISLAIVDFKPQFSYQTFPKNYDNLGQELAVKLFLIPFLKGEGRLWIKNRLCKECERLFFYKSEKAQFCSDACKMKHVRKSKAQIK